MGQPHVNPAPGRTAALNRNSREAVSDSARTGLSPPEGLRSPWSDPREEEPLPVPEITAPFLARVLSRVADNLCGTDRDDPQA